MCGLPRANAVLLFDSDSGRQFPRTRLLLIPQRPPENTERISKRGLSTFNEPKLCDTGKQRVVISHCPLDPNLHFKNSR